MKISVTTIALAEMDVDLLLLPVAEDHAADLLARFADEVDPAFGRAGADFTGAKDTSLVLYPDDAEAKRVALIGLGPSSAVDAERLREAGATGAGFAARHKASTVALSAPDGLLDAETVGQAFVEGFVLGSYRFDRYKTNETDRFGGPDRLVLHAQGSGDKSLRRGGERGRVIAEAVSTARDLVNLSPHDKTATLLSKAIEKVGKKAGFDVSVWDKALIEEEGMGGLLAVNRGSQEPPTFTVLEWNPENAANRRPIVLVGKGVVYDTGGLSLKKTEGSMEFMKSDMGGAAAVVGAMEAVANLKLPLYVVGLIPATDNRPGENAYVPGDVVTMHSGKTVEVLNTDAEGRMLLADALSYAKTYKPDLVVDLATLTGAVVVTLGNEAAGIMTSETEGAEERLARFQEAGRRAGERVHPLPMYAAYGDLLKSDVADIKNIGGRGAGTISAAKFLEHFVDYPWVHIDIAGVAFFKEARPYRPKGGTGFGVRLLVEYLREQADPRKRR